MRRGEAWPEPGAGGNARRRVSTAGARSTFDQAMSAETTGQGPSVRQALGWALVAALTVAGLTASVALIGGSFDETEARVLGTSLGFAVFSATAASGAALRFRQSEGLRALGLLTVAASAAAFLLLVAALWSDEYDEALWRVWGCTALAALASSHASLVLGGRRPADSDLVRLLIAISVVTAVVDASLAGAAVAEVVDEVDEGLVELMGVLVIALLLTTVLPPIIRRLQLRPARATELAATSRGVEPEPPTLAAEVIAVADRIEELNADPGNRAPEIRRECERLRQVARAYSR